VSLAAREPKIAACPLCGSGGLRPLFRVRGCRVEKCGECGFVLQNPQPSDEALRRIYGEGYFLGSASAEGRREAGLLKRSTARLYLEELRRYHGPTKGRLLEVGCGEGDFLCQAEASGWDVTGVEYSPPASQVAGRRLKKGRVFCGELKDAALPEGEFDLCVISDVLEHVRSPLDFLREIHRALRPGGTLFVVTPSVDSWSARLLRRHWMEFKPEHLAYFDSQTLQTALFKTGFRQIVLQPGWKILSFDYVRSHFERFPVPVLTPLVRLLACVLPGFLRRQRHRVVASGVMAFSRKAAVQKTAVLSVIVPVYNEAKTFVSLMDCLLRKELPGLKKEIIIVESNSTDGTRQAALKYRDHPGVKLIFEDAPRGKGHAVRAGLAAATGDYVLIQDADLEYDLDDYDALMEPLLAGRCAFVLGSRHGRRGMKMRQFAGQRGLSLFLNLGHWIFTALINALFAQKLRDPFTMFKVFRRDCLHGLEFKCDRFDFDYELLIKLIRKGYRPLELPVNYRSRSFREGKKVRIFRDPLTWLAVLVRLRCEGRPDLMRAVEGGGERRGRIPLH
jgi:glycosyltransferase involved in cell wall biosynthesis/ubiquinone/menaquinone biosynthesis C-methylase UbiE